MSVTIEAVRPGRCSNCDYGIRPGQRIVLAGPLGATEWVHGSCPAAPAVCPECFTEVARNGACMCGAV